MTQMVSEEMVKVLTEEFKKLPDAGRMLETGTGYGHSAVLFAKLKPEWSIYTVDCFGLYGDGRVYTEWNHEAMKDLNERLPQNVIQILGDSAKVKWEFPLTALYIDANHTYEGCKADYENYGPHVVKGGLIIFDDYLQPGNEANGVKRVVDEIQYELIYKSDRFVIIRK